MPRPNIDPRWDSDRDFPLRKTLVAGLPVLLLVLAVVLSFLKGCNKLGDTARNDVYPPRSWEGGLVGHADRLLEVLLTDTDGTVHPTNLEELNKKYRALVFDLPYATDDVTCIEGADLRLVGIRNDRVPDALKSFYFNSRLPQLLQQQSDFLAQTYFRIKMKNVNQGMRSSLEIESIHLIPSLFRVAMSKDPWMGTILGANDCLFENAVYVVLGTTVLPLPRNKTPDMTNPYRLDMVDDGLVMKDGTPFDPYRYFLEAFDAHRSVAIYPLKGDNRCINLCATDTSLVVSTQFDFSYGNRQEHAGQKDFRVRIEEGAKLFFFTPSNRRLAEISLHEDSPSRILSCPERTALGSDRHTIARGQTDLFTQQLVRGLEGAVQNGTGVKGATLTIDPLLSKAFEEELRGYLKQIRVNAPKNQKDEEYDISLTVMDMATGDVLATPFYKTQFEHEKADPTLQLTTRNVALTRRYVGSTFKPMLALAAVMARPELLDLTTQGKCGRVDESTAWFLGHKAALWARNTNHWQGTDFVNFLAHSDDVYPVALAALALSRSSDDGLLAVDDASTFEERGGLLFVRRGAAQRPSPFLYWLSWLYAANYSSNESSDLHLFDGLFAQPTGSDIEHEERRLRLAEVSPDITNLHYDALYRGGNFRSLFVPWVLGQGSNEWNCVKIAEAWCRMIGKRDVRAHFIHADSATREMPASLVSAVDRNYTTTVLGKRRDQEDINTTWNAFLDKFAEAPKSGLGGSTLSPMYEAVGELNRRMGEDLVLFSKTGTPDDYARNEMPLLTSRKRIMDVGMYTFALVKRGELEKIKRNRQGRGLVCVLRITRSYTCKQCSEGRRCKACKQFDGLGSRHARDFFARDAKRLDKLYRMTKRYY